VMMLFAEASVEPIPQLCFEIALEFLQVDVKALPEVVELDAETLLVLALDRRDALEQLTEVFEVVEVAARELSEEVLARNLSVSFVQLDEAIRAPQPIVLAVRLQTDIDESGVLVLTHLTPRLHALPFEFLERGLKRRLFSGSRRVFTWVLEGCSLLVALGYLDISRRWEAV